MNKILFSFCLIIITFSVGAQDVSFSVCNEVLVCAERNEIQLNSEMIFLKDFFKKTYKVQVEYLDAEYKKKIHDKKAGKISSDPEVVQIKEFYEYNILDARIFDVEKRGENVLVTMLACFKKDNRAGLSTVLFTLSKIKDKWKIVDIAIFY